MPAVSARTPTWFCLLIFIVPQSCHPASYVTAEVSADATFTR